MPSPPQHNLIGGVASATHKPASDVARRPVGFNPLVTRPAQQQKICRRVGVFAVAAAHLSGATVVNLFTGSGTASFAAPGRPLDHQVTCGRRGPRVAHMPILVAAQGKHDRRRQK